eukprot:comp11526_c0_seq1/m.5975 comp11526_c0_seq1/g.5975  ORF comp11526_c0_seq1/g.5975 comp11526_c0_seq1/m.5975 type:complete len:360 (-) comp11526_c0_seq1:158-1237(-)
MKAKLLLQRPVSLALFTGFFLFLYYVGSRGRRHEVSVPKQVSALGHFQGYNVKMGPEWDQFSKACFDHWDTVGHYSYEVATKAWGHPPSEGASEGGEYAEYVSSKLVLTFTDQQVRNFIKRQETTRLNEGEGAFHNYQGKWIKLFHDGITGKHIVDYGSGFGIETLQFLRAGNRVSLADINMDNMNAAERIINVAGYKVERKILISDHYPFFEYDPSWEKVDIFYSNGVLHHSPRIRHVMRRAHEVVKSGGQMILLLYSDLMWDHCMRWYGPAKETSPRIPPIDEEVQENPRMCDFVVCADKVGHYADWYSAEKIAVVSHGFFEVQTYDYLTPNNAFCAVTLSRNDNAFDPTKITTKLD